jgi:ribonuclease HI
VTQITITEDLAIDLLEAYIKKLALLNKLKGLNANKIEKIRDIESKVENLITQLRNNNVDVDGINNRIVSETIERVYSKVVKVHTDGAARGNNDPSQPNRSAIGFAVYLDGGLFHEEARYIGGSTPIPIMKSQSDSDRVEVLATNNTSEYLAIIAALGYLVENGYTSKKIQILSDSNVVVQQINLTNASRASHLIQLRNVARELIEEFDDIEICHIPREENTYADKIVNDILDSQERGELNE